MSGVNGISSDRNYDSIINSAGKEKVESVYGDAIFSDGKDDSLSVSDFFNLMITQLTNQDFMKPVDDTQYLAQLAQFSTMEQMTQLAEFSKTNYATSLLGKEVTVARNNAKEGEDGIVTGVVNRVSIKDDTYYVQVGGEEFSISQIKNFGIPEEDSSKSEVEAEKLESLDKLISNVIDDEEIREEISEQVQFWL